jgi:uncharacterized membrane protein SpoIIM required for sporulation
MSDRDGFIAGRRARWDELEAALIGKGRGDHGARDYADLARLYRAVCADLSMARSLQVPSDVQRYLDELAGRAHNQLYATRGREAPRWLRAALVEFPVELRRSWPFVLASVLLFYGPFFFGGFGALLIPGFASSVLPEAMLQQMESMYAEETARVAGQDAAMAGFYVYNNVGIAFRCFGLGIFAGLGTIWTLFYNGLVLGTVFGFLFSAGVGHNLLGFTSGHSAWELNGIVVAGAGGLRLGWAVIVTHGRTRAGSLKAAGPVLFRLMAGAATMLLIAAAIEGFWSASPIPRPIKYAFGLVQFVIVFAWLLLGGRGAKS